MGEKNSPSMLLCQLAERYRDQQVEPSDRDPVRPEVGPDHVEVDRRHEVLGRRRDRQEGHREGRQDFAEMRPWQCLH